MPYQAFRTLDKLEFDQLVVRIDRNRTKSSLKTSKKIKNRSDM